MTEFDTDWSEERPQGGPEDEDPRDPDTRYMMSYEPPEREETDPSQFLGPPAPEPPTPITQGFQIGGTFDAWAGVVLKVYYDDGGHPDSGNLQDIDVVRCDLRWAATTNIPSLTHKPTPANEPTPNHVIASPFPPREDQPGYHVVVGDPVTVITGKDGLCYYFLDNEPFVGEVALISAEEVENEDTSGGIGNYYLRVRRVQLLSDPDGGAFAWGTTAFHAAYTALYYAKVWVAVAPGQTHGYRLGEKCLVWRKGRYFFTHPRRESFLAELTDAGPDSEANETGAYYWFKEIGINAEYAGDNQWGFTTVTDLTSTNKARHGLALNLRELASDTHALDDSGGRYVIVHMGRNVEEGDYEHQPYYTFDAGDNPWAFCIDETYNPHYPAGNVDPAWTAIASGTEGDITGDPADATHYWATGSMYVDANGNLNPWVFLDFARVFCQEETYNPWGETTPSGVDITTTDLTAATNFFAKGWMARDDSEPSYWNPWFAIEFADVFCHTAAGNPWDVENLPEATDATGNANEITNVYVTGHMDFDGDAWNPWFTVNPTTAGFYKVKCSADDANVGYLEDNLQGDIDDASGSWIEVDTALPAGNEYMLVKHMGPGVGVEIDVCDFGGGANVFKEIWIDAKGHVTKVVLNGAGGPWTLQPPTWAL